MKVLSYLELAKEYFVHKTEVDLNLDYTEQLQFFCKMFDLPLTSTGMGEYNINVGDINIYKLYNQTFYPELITELFEDIVVEKGVYKDTNGKFWFRLPLMCSETEEYMPRTLDDFICDCERAGIELEWKEGTK